MQNRINISIAINEAYIPYAYIMLTSLFENNKHRDIRIYLMYGSIPDEALSVFEQLENKYHQEIYCMQVPQDVFPDYLPRTKEWTLEVYYRLLLQDMLPEEDERVLQMDVDMIVNGPLDELYDTDFNGKSLVVCRDMSVKKVGLVKPQQELFSDIKDNSDFAYFNAGIMLMNLDKLRQIITFSTFLETALAHKNELFAQDQDLLNFLFYGDVIYADEKKFDAFAKIMYNDGMGYDYIKQNVNVIHFAGSKPWSPDACRYSTEKLWWEYAKLTPYYTELMECTFIGEMNEGYADKQIIRLCNEKDDMYALLLKVQQLLPSLGK